MHSRLQEYPETFLVHSRALEGAFSHLGPKSLTFQARGMCRWGLPPFPVQQLEGEGKPPSHSAPLFSLLPIPLPNLYCAPSILRIPQHLMLVTKPTKATLISSPCFSKQLSNFEMVISSTTCVTCYTLSFTLSYFFFLLFKMRISTLIPGLTFLPLFRGGLRAAGSRRGRMGCGAHHTTWA